MMKFMKISTPLIFCMLAVFWIKKNHLDSYLVKKEFPSIDSATCQLRGAGRADLNPILVTSELSTLGRCDREVYGNADIYIDLRVKNSDEVISISVFMDDAFIIFGDDVEANTARMEGKAVECYTLSGALKKYLKSVNDL